VAVKNGGDDGVITVSTSQRRTKTIVFYFFLLFIESVPLVGLASVIGWAVLVGCVGW
jgi:hypothetical protein